MAGERVLFLGPDTSPLVAWLREQGEQVVQTTERLTVDALPPGEHTFLVSYGYRYLIPGAVLARFPDRAINLHISYLPWNRGADPNFWSFVEDTPKGVTIHHLDEGLDTGDIIVQETIEVDPGTATLATVYRDLQAAIQDLFRRSWRDLVNGSLPRRPQTGPGSAHRSRDKEALAHLLTDGWDTRVSALAGRAADR